LLRPTLAAASRFGREWLAQASEPGESVVPPEAAVMMRHTTSKTRGPNIVD
jgi:hypothetical protein